MHYFIDGYNYLFRLGFGDKDFSQSRQHFIEELNLKVQSSNIEVTLVFDAQYQAHDMTRSHYQNLEILYSSYGETADDLILNEVKAERNIRQVVVVTSDKKLAWFARRCAAKTESIEEFNTWLNRRYKNRIRDKKKKPVQKEPVQLVKLIQDVKPEKKKSVKPVSGATLEQCEDYYLDQFEKRLQDSEQPLTKPPKHKVFHKEPKVKQKSKPQSVASEKARWLKLFESKLDEEI